MYFFEVKLRFVTFKYSRLPIIRTFRENKKKVRVIGSSSYREQNYAENEPKGNENCFDLARGLSYREFESPEVDCNSFSSISTNKDA